MGRAQSAIYSKTKLYKAPVSPRLYTIGFGSKVTWFRLEARHIFFTLNVYVTVLEIVAVRPGFAADVW
jgi:hypothetical protein